MKKLVDKFMGQPKAVKIAAIVVAAFLAFGLSYALIGSVRGALSNPPQAVLEQRKAKEEAQLRADKEKELERKGKEEAESAAEKEKQAEKSAEDTIKSLVGKTVAEADETASSLGYTIVCLDENTELDMTSDIRALGTAGEWSVIKVGKIDTSKKTVTLYVLSSEVAEANRQAESTKDALTEKLDPAFAWDAAEQYGKDQYPYGFKLKNTMGRIAEEPHDENTWFLKATCDVTNIYGTKQKNLTCEALVTGTTDNPQVIEFYVY